MQLVLARPRLRARYTRPAVQAGAPGAASSPFASESTVLPVGAQSRIDRKPSKHLRRCFHPNPLVLQLVSNSPSTSVTGRPHPWSWARFSFELGVLGSSRRKSSAATRPPRWGDRTALRAPDSAGAISIAGTRDAVLGMELQT
ncbi:hypothetical protein B0H14DRAFT_2582808 [Mycena olivaceomarginata]|nr:hypothetical protein B0H14DRAFT_2582808 [Mycena olivaceomarginata]